MKTTHIGFGNCREHMLKNCSDLTDTRFVLFSDAAESIKALIKLIKSYYVGMIGIDEEDLAKVLSYGENTYKAIFSVSETLGNQRIEDCIDKVMSHRLVCAKPVMTLYEAFFPLDCKLQHLKGLESAFDKSISGLMLDECDPEVVIVAVYDKAPQ